jgi:hypothetical protein
MKSHNLSFIDSWKKRGPELSHSLKTTMIFRVGVFSYQIL